ncbi:MAG: amidohydrolase [Candidatus Cloacimonetes bacterium]|nr:amidohydrolase [Candidatus Cloacimonadota bacterium]
MFVDLILKNATVLSVDENDTILYDSSVVIKDNYIYDILSDAEAVKKYESINIVDIKKNILMPGLINAHTHLPMSFMKGIADDLPLDDWLQKHIWPVEAKFINEEFIYESSLFGAGEAIKNGVTMCNDMYFLEEQVAEACKKMGLRVCVGEGILDFPSAVFTDLEKRFTYLRSLSEKYQKDRFVDVAIAPHSIYTCCNDTLKRCVEFSKDYNLPVHIHLSETKKEVEDCQKEHGMLPTHYLNETGMLDLPIVTVAHGVWLQSDEIELLKNKNISVIINIDSNLKLASGFPPMEDFVRYGMNYCLGTDGVASNNNLSIIEEMGTLAKLYKGLYSDPTFLSAKEVVRAATINAASALGKRKQLGSLESGKLADIIVVDVNNIESQPLYNLYSQIVYNLNSDKIKHTIIDGKFVMKDRKLVNHDEKELILLAKNYQKQIKAGE